MKKTYLIILAVITLTTSCYPIIELKKVNLNEALDIAMKNNLSIKVSDLDVKISKNKIKEANKLNNPELNTYWNFGKAGKGNPEQVGVSERIDILKRSSRKKLAKINYQTAKDNFELRKFNLKMDVKEAYVKLAAAKQMLKTIEDEQELLDSFVIPNYSNKKSKNSVSKVEQIQEKIALNQLTTQINKARVNVKTARIDFNQVINTIDGNYDSFDSELPKKGDFIDLNIPKIDFEMPKYEEIEKRAFKKRYDIKIAEDKIEISKENFIKIARKKIPDIELQGGYLFQPKNLSEYNRYSSGGYVGLNLINLPVFYTYKPEIQNAKLQIEQAELDYVATVNSAKRSLEAQYEKFVTSKMNLNFYNDKLIKDSNELITLAIKDYRTGRLDLTSLIVAEQSYREIIIGYIKAIEDYYVDWIDFLREVNSENLDIDGILL